MSDVVPVQTDRAPAAIGPYSQAVLADGWVFCSGQIPVDPKTGELEPTGHVVNTPTPACVKFLRSTI